MYEEDYFTKSTYKPYFDFPAHSERVAKIINIAHPKSVLDVGCAYGYIVRRLLWKGVDAWGCDISQWCEEQAKTIIPERFIRTPCWDLSMFKDKQFDLLYCEGVLEHIDENKITLVMNEFERVSKERFLQVAFITDPNVTQEYGHDNLHDYNWWFNYMPKYSWLAMNGASNNSIAWFYKG